MINREAITTSFFFFSKAGTLLDEQVLLGDKFRGDKRKAF